MIGCARVRANRFADQHCNRHDIAFATNMLARYASNPSPEHISYANRVLRYLSGTIEMGITYHGTDEILNSGGYDITNKLIGTVDSDLGGCKDSEKSTSGIVLMLNGGPIMWRSTRQSAVSTGTAEAECKATGFAGQQLIPVRDLLCELGFEQPSVRMLEDNSAAVQLSFGTGKLGKSGHFCSIFVVWLHIWKDLLIEIYFGLIIRQVKKIQVIL